MHEHIIKVKEEIMPHKHVTVQPGDPMLLEDGSVMQFPREDANGPVLDENGDPIIDIILNQENEPIELAVLKTEAEIAAEKQAHVDAKIAEIQAKINAYEAGKQYQMENGGPAPVAEEEIMCICNQHDCQFQVIFEEE